MHDCLRAARSPLPISVSIYARHQRLRNLTGSISVPYGQHVPLIALSAVLFLDGLCFAGSCHLSFSWRAAITIMRLRIRTNVPLPLASMFGDRSSGDCSSRVCHRRYPGSRRIVDVFALLPVAFHTVPRGCATATGKASAAIPREPPVTNEYLTHDCRR